MGFGFGDHGSAEEVEARGTIGVRFTLAMDRHSQFWYRNYGRPSSFATVALAGFAERKNISHVDAPEPEIARARDESPDITGSDIDATGPQSIPARSVETPATNSPQDIKASAETKSFVSTPEFVDTQLLNSMSTQERRAVKAPASTALPENPNANETKAGLKTEANARF